MLAINPFNPCDVEIRFDNVMRDMLRMATVITKQ
jgi:hypothetical protein